MKAAARSSPLWPSAASAVVGVIGDPVRHSLSPLIHNAAFDAMDLDWVSVAFEVPKGQLPEALEGMRALGIVGLSVTHPHKDAAARAVDERSELARRLAAVNCVTLRDGKLVGDSTDGDGFLLALRRGADFDPQGRRCVVIGAGGAARAVVLSLAQAGASEVVVVNRTPERAESAAQLAGAAGRPGSAREIEGAQLVVHATPLGMIGRVEELAVEPDVFRPGQLAVDLVYQPAVTPFLKAATDRGARTLGGLGMLVHQAALAIERWTGRPAPVEKMWDAALAAVDSRRP